MRIEILRRDSLARRRLMVSCVLLVLLAPGSSLWPIASLFAQKRARPDTTIWSGKSGGFILIWTTADITVSPADQPSKVVFSAREIALKKFDASEARENFAEREGRDARGCKLNREWQPIQTLAHLGHGHLIMSRQVETGQNAVLFPPQFRHA